MRIYGVEYIVQDIARSNSRGLSQGCVIPGIHDKPGGYFSPPRKGGDSRRGMLDYVRFRLCTAAPGRWHPIE